MRRRWIAWAIVVALAAGVRAWVAVRLAHRAPNVAPNAASPADSSATGFQTVTLYFAAPSGDSLVEESRSVIAQTDLHARIASLVDALARGPSATGLALVPAGTAVVHAYLDDRGLLTLDLAAPFRDEFRGGATAELLAVGSIVRTLAANVPEAQRLQLACGGQPLPSLDGHVPLDQPLDLAHWP